MNEWTLEWMNESMNECYILDPSFIQLALSTTLPGQFCRENWLLFRPVLMKARTILELECCVQVRDYRAPTSCQNSSTQSLSGFTVSHLIYIWWVKNILFDCCRWKNWRKNFVENFSGVVKGWCWMSWCKIYTMITRPVTQPWWLGGRALAS